MLIKVKVFANSKKEVLIKEADDQYQARVKEKAERGLANKRVIDLLALHFKSSRIRMIKGARAKNKIFEVITLVR